MDRIRVIGGHALFFGAFYGAFCNFLTEVTLLYTQFPELREDKHFLNLPFACLDSSFAMMIYMLYLPQFRWQIAHDIYRDTKTNWKMSFQTFGFLVFLYPAMIEVLKTCTVLFSDPVPISRVFVRISVTACITAILESFNIFEKVRREMLQDMIL